MRGWWSWLLLAACEREPDEMPAAVTEVNRWPEGVWNPADPDTTLMAPVRGLVPRRAVFHLHSPFSHDACDGLGWVDGAMDVSCEQDLRDALCAAGYDVAFITDHPDYGDAQPFDALFHAREGDTWVVDDLGRRYALDTACADGRKVQWRAGFEDELMPVSLHQHVDPDPVVRHELLNGTDPAAVAAMQEAGGWVMLAHTEGRDGEWLLGMQAAGLHAVEVFNVHAMFAPDIRAEALGLDALGWAMGIGPFLDADSSSEPDLLFLAVHQEQAPTVAHLDALLQQGPMMITAGSDAHQNVLPLVLRDGERGDSYRRTLRWFSTMLLARGTDAAAIDEAVEQRRSYVVFESLGTPAGFDVHLEAGGEVYEMGADAPTGTLVVSCPVLGDGSPHGDQEPEITVHVLKDGQPWQTGCGRWEASAGVYRVRVDIVPHHLSGFLGSLAATLVHSYPWVYSGAIRVDLPSPG